MCKNHPFKTIYSWGLVVILMTVTTGYTFHLPHLSPLECPWLQAKLHIVQPIVLQTFPPAIWGEMKIGTEMNLPPAMRGGLKGGVNNIPLNIVEGNKKGSQKLNDDSSTTSDSSSWLPRIIIPVAAVAVLATVTYLIYSRRGG
jgi:hypothetical protein